MNSETSKLRYFSYLLRLWEVGELEGRSWRLSLERPGSGERVGFVSLAELVTFLEQRMVEKKAEMRSREDDT